VAAAFSSNSIGRVRVVTFGLSPTRSRQVRPIEVSFGLAAWIWLLVQPAERQGCPPARPLPGGRRGAQHQVLAAARGAAGSDPVIATVPSALPSIGAI